MNAVLKNPLVQKWGKPLLIVAALLLVLKIVLGSRKDWAIVAQADPKWLLAGMGLFFIHYVIQAFGWCFILRAMGQPATLAVSFRMYYMSMIARWAPGRIWYSATRLLMAKEAGISVTAVTFGIVLELIYILVGGILASLLFAGSLVKGLLASAGGEQMLIAVCAVAFICGALCLRPGFLLWMSRFKFFRKAVKKLAGEELTDQNTPSLSTAKSLGLLTYYTLFWIYSGVMFGVLSHAFLPHMTGAQWLACIPAFAGSWLVGFFSIVTPAGLGTREVAMGFMLHQVMPTSQAAVLTIASRLAMLATELLSAGLFSLLLKNSGKRLKDVDGRGSDDTDGTGGGGQLPAPAPKPNDIITDSGVWRRLSSKSAAGAEL